MISRRTAAALSVRSHPSSLLRQRSTSTSVLGRFCLSLAPSASIRTNICRSSLCRYSSFHSIKCSIGAKSNKYGSRSRSSNDSTHFKLPFLGGGDGGHQIQELAGTSPPSLINLTKKFFSTIPTTPSNLNIRAQKETIDRINRTNEILKNIPIGSMTSEQIVQTKNLMYQWLYSKEVESSRGANQAKPIHPKVFEAAKIAHSLLQRLIDEYDDGCKDDVFYNALTVKEYNTIMSTYRKSINNSFKRFFIESRGEKKKMGHRKKKKRGMNHQAEEEDQENEAVIKVEALFQQMKERFDKHNSLFDVGTMGSSSASASGAALGHESDRMMPPRPDIITYNILLSVYSCQLQNEVAVQKAENIISLLESHNGNDPNQILPSYPYPEPDTITYNTLMNIYANQIGEYGYAQKAEDVLLKMSKLRKEGSNTVIPDTNSFNIVLKAWRNSGGGNIESAKRAEEILRLMFKLYLEGHEGIKPDGISISTVANAYASPQANIDNKRTDYEDPVTEKTLELYDSLIDFLLKDTGDFPFTDPDHVVSAFNTITHSIAKSNIDHAGERANYFLQRLIDASQLSLPSSSENKRLGPDRITYSNVIGAYIKDKDIESATSMLDDIIKSDDMNIKPNAYTFNKCLQHYCKRGPNIEAAQNLYDTMYRMAKENKTNGINDVVMLDTVTYNLMVEMYVDKSIKDRSRFGQKLVDKAMSLIDEMEYAFKSGMMTSLDGYIYEIVIDRLQKRSVVKRRSGIGELSYDILMKMIQHHLDRHLAQHPYTFTCNLVLSALTREHTKEAAEKAMALLNHMEQMEKDGKTLVAPDDVTYNHVLVCWLRSGSPATATNAVVLFERMMQKYKSGKSSFVLNAPIFETVLHCLSHNKYGDGNAVKSVLNEMTSLSKDDKNCSPTSTCLNIAIKAATPSDTQILLLLQLIKQFKDGEIDVLPDVIGFNTALSTLARHGHHDALHRAEKIFVAMEQLSKQEGLQYVMPDQYTFSTMFNIYGRFRRSEKAQKLLKKIEKGSVKLDTHGYNSMLFVWTRSADQRKGIKAAMLLDRMIDLEVANFSSFNLALRACAHIIGNDQVQGNTLDAALRIYKRLISSQSMKPDEDTFVAVLIAIKKLSKSKEQREELSKQLFDDCCRHGLVGTLFIEEMNSCIPESDQLKVLGYDLNSVPLEKEWKKNLKRFVK